MVLAIFWDVWLAAVITSVEGVYLWLDANNESHGCTAFGAYCW